MAARGLCSRDSARDGWRSGLGPGAVRAPNKEALARALPGPRHTWEPPRSFPSRSRSGCCGAGWASGCCSWLRGRPQPPPPCESSAPGHAAAQPALTPLSLRAPLAEPASLGKGRWMRAGTPRGRGLPWLQDSPSSQGGNPCPSAPWRAPAERTPKLSPSCHCVSPPL